MRSIYIELSIIRPYTYDINSDVLLWYSGETAAGKSSFINLLLGANDLMPTSQLGCTATICELRTNKAGKKEAIAYFR